mgnify:CR=1 FL=1
MAVDRGSLRYEIRLTTGQTFRNLRKFRDELKGAKTDFKAFKSELRGSGQDAAVAAGGINKLAGSVERLGAARGANRNLTEQVKGARDARTSYKLLLTELRGIRAELSRVQNRAKATGRELRKVGDTAAASGRKGATGLKRLDKSLKQTTGSTDRLAGSFLRMAGIISTFVVARGVIDGVRTLVEQSISFNRTVERSELGISAILSAVGEVRGAFGQTVDQVEQLNLAQGEARRQTQLLRKDALTTAATFEQLLEVFQVALAPGLTAGLDVDEVRNFALRISQAALALGVAQNQLSEEIRSILSGTIRPQTTRIALALNITNEDVKKMRELGRLSEFLEDRFAAFGAAGKKALTTVDGLLGRVVDGFGQIAGAAGKSVGFFDAVKEGLNDLLDLLLDFDEFGFPTPDAETLDIIQTFFAGISEGFQDMRDTLGDITFEEAKEAAATFATIVVEGIKLIIGVVEGLANGLAFVGSVMAEVAQLVGFKEGKEDIRAIARFFATILTTTVALKAVFGSLIGLASNLAKSFAFAGEAAVGLFNVLNKIPVVQRTIIGLTNAGQLAWSIYGTTAVNALKSSLLFAAKFAAAFAAAVASIKVLVLAITGLDVSIGETVQLIGLAFEEVWVRIRFGAELAFKAVGEAALRLVAVTIGPLLQTVTNLIGGVAAASASVGAISEKTRQSVEDTLAKTDAGLAKVRASLKNPLGDVLGLGDTLAKQKTALEEISAAYAEIAKSAQDRKDAERSAADSATGGAQDITNVLDTQQGAAESLLDTLQRVTSSFSTVRTAITKVSTESDRLQAALSKFDTEDQFSIDPALEGTAAQVAKAIQAEQVKSAKALGAIRKETLATERLLSETSRLRQDSDQKSLLFTEQQQQTFTRVAESLRGVLDLQEQQSRLETEISLAKQEGRAAAEAGDASAELAAKATLTRLAAEKQALEDQKSALADRINQVKLSGSLDQEALQFLQERLAIISKEAGLKADVLNLNQEIDRLVRDSLEVQARAAERVAQQTLRAAEERVAQLRVEAELLSEIARIESGTGPSGAATRLLQLDAQLRTQERQVETSRQSLLLQQQEILTALRTSDLNSDKAVALRKQLELIQEQRGLNEALGEIERASLQRAREKARILAEGTAGEAITVGVEEFIDQVGTLQEQLAQLTTSLLQTFSSGLANAISTSIVQAFDEQGRFSTELFLESLRQQTGRLIQTIAQQILQSAVQSLISSMLQGVLTSTTVQTTTALANAATEQTSAVLAADTRVIGALTAAEIEIAAAQTAAAIRAGGGALGVAASTGGLIPQAFANGGSVGAGKATPPPGVPRSDTVPAWLTPGEFVHKTDAVRHYGVDVMRALNRRLIDPGLLKGLAGVKALKSFRTQTSRGPGFAEGDLVPTRVQDTAAPAAVVETSRSDSSPFAAMPVGEQALETLLASGEAAFRRFLRDNAADYDGILRGGRTGG